MVVARVLVGGASAGVLRPQPLGVAGEALVQPDVAPAPRGHGVAEPLVGQFVGDQPLRAALAVAVVGAEDRNALRLKRNLEIVVGDHDGVAVRQRVRAEQLDEELHHLGLAPEVVVEVLAQPLRQNGVHRHRLLGDAVLLVLADLQRDEVGRRGLGLLVGPRGHRGPGPAGHQLAVGQRVVRVLGA